MNAAGKRTLLDERFRDHEPLQRVTRDPRTGVQIRVGVMGSAGGLRSRRVDEICRRLGHAVAERGCCLLTGASSGLPHEAVLGARSANGHVVGVSPGMNLREHVDVFKSPYKEYGVLIFTGLGLMGRELINIYSSDIVVIIGGRSGTLGELAIAYESGKLIGVLTRTGGISGVIAELHAKIRKETGAQIIYGSQPERLIDKLLARYLSAKYTCPCLPKSVRRKHLFYGTQRGGKK